MRSCSSLASVRLGSASVSGAVSARCRLSQPSPPVSSPRPAHSTSPVVVSSSSIAGRVVAHAAGQDEALPGGCRQRHPGELVDRGHQAVDAAKPRSRGAGCGGGVETADLLPVGQEAAERALRHRLDLGAQSREAAAAQAAQHLGVDPLGAGRTRAELALDRAPLGGQPAQRIRHHRDAEPEPGRGLGGRERRVGAGVAADQVADRIAHRVEEGARHADRQRHPEGVAQAGGVFDHGPAVLAGDRDAQHAVGAGEVVEDASS